MASRSKKRVEPEALSDATLSFVHAFTAWLRRASVTSAGTSAPRVLLLHELHRNGPRKMADLADALGVTPRAVTTLVDALEAERLLRRGPHPTDRRVTIVELTGAAESVEGQFAAFQSAIGALFSDLPEKDRRALLRVTEKLVKRIEMLEAPPDSGLKPA
jgi:DNA-binding MarR family transcriptional regulator